MLKPYFIQAQAGDIELYREQLLQTVNRLADQLAKDSTPAPNHGSTAMADQLRLDISLNGKLFDELLDKTLSKLVAQSVRVDHPNCVAHLQCPTLISALAAEIILTTLNQSMDSWDQAPIATHMEQQMVTWLCQQSGYCSDANGTFTSGGTQSNLMGLLLARDFAMNRGKHTVQEQGLQTDFRKYKVVVSEAAHFSIAKSCALLGLGSEAVISVATDNNGAMCCQALKHTLQQLKRQGQQAMAIVATAGTTDIGAIDPISSIADITQEYGSWLHVDAAYGGALLLSSQKPLLAGIERADSITIDFHKMFFQPISCSALLVKSEKTLSPVCFHADYLSRENDDESNLVDYSLATTRRFDALKLWLSLQHMGLRQFNTAIEKLLTLAQQTANLIEISPDLELLQRPILSTVLFRLSAQTDEFHQKLRRYLLQNGLAVIAETSIQQKVYLKFTLLNPCTELKDISALLDLISNTALTLSQQTPVNYEHKHQLPNHY